MSNPVAMSKKELGYRPCVGVMLVNAQGQAFVGKRIDNKEGDWWQMPQGGVDIQTVGMEFSFILTQVRKAAEILEVGAVQEVAIRTAALTLVIRVVTPEYFVALAIRPDGTVGKGR